WTWATPTAVTEFAGAWIAAAAVRCVHAAFESLTVVAENRVEMAAPVASRNSAPTRQVLADTADRNQASGVTHAPAGAGVPAPITAACTCADMSPPATEVMSSAPVPPCACAAVAATVEFTAVTQVPMPPSKSVCGLDSVPRSAVTRGAPPRPPVVVFTGTDAPPGATSTSNDDWPPSVKAPVLHAWISMPAIVHVCDGAVSPTVTAPADACVCHAKYPVQSPAGQ